MDVTIGYSSPTKEILETVKKIKETLANGDLTLTDTIGILASSAGSALTQENSGAFVELSDDLIKFAASFSVDLGLDFWNLVQARAQLGVGAAASVVAEVKLKPADAAAPTPS